MKFEIIFCSSRQITIELEENAIYETAGYEVWINQELSGTK